MSTQLFDTQYCVTSRLSPSDRILYQIKVDIQRGLQRFHQIFHNQELISTQLQQLFEKYFIQFWQRLPLNIQTMYYQGLTDIFEVVFASQINMQNVPLILEALQYDSNINLDFKLIFKDPQASFQYSTNIAKQLFQKTQFKFEYNNEISVMVLTYVNQFDPLLSMILSYVEYDLRVAMLLKYTINCCLHVTDLYSVSFLLGEFYLNRSQQEQAFLIQSLLSVAARVVLPQYFDQNELDQVYQYKLKFEHHNTIIEQVETYTDIAMMILNQVIQDLISNVQNENHLIVLINDITKNIQQYMKRKCQQ
ncbi:Conserved_hypothetical protein [Hexamita inflata]|uniref:Uncharacterized protein n=1 Tax=Hexamita inflata TaxID=28002 RepID=A0AA86NY12_9EUKA|nr:Conserved hypothetical protein [Hexamita inflata]